MMAQRKDEEQPPQGPSPVKNACFQPPDKDNPRRATLRGQSLLIGEMLSLRLAFLHFWQSSLSLQSRRIPLSRVLQAHSK
jgi:hypothetical protein